MLISFLPFVLHFVCSSPGSTSALFLRGFSVFVTPSVQRPSPEALKQIIHAAGGTALSMAPIPSTSPTATTLIVSCAEDAKMCTKLRKHGFRIYETEIILSGVLKQKLELDQSVWTVMCFGQAQRWGG